MTHKMFVSLNNKGILVKKIKNPPLIQTKIISLNNKGLWIFKRKIKSEVCE